MNEELKLDRHYHEKKLRLVLRDLTGMPADEYARALIRLANVADDSVMLEPEFTRATHPAPTSVGGVEAELAKLEAGMPRLMQANYDLRQERDTALAECERLRELLRQSIDAMRTPYSDTQLQAKIDAALSAKP